MTSAWADAMRVAHLAAAVPHGLGGVVLRARAGPVRDHWLDTLRAHLPDGTPFRRMPVGIADDRLIGGLDLAATLAAGRPIAEAGLLAEAEGGIVVVPMAERLEPGTAARLAAALDTGSVQVARDGLTGTFPARFGLILLDEGDEPSERAPDALAERLAFHLDLGSVAWGDVVAEERNSDAAVSGTAVREKENDGTSHDDAIAALCRTGTALGITSLRAPLFAVRVARLTAALDGRNAPSEADVIEAARLVLGPRATQMPSAETVPEDSGQADQPSETASQDDGNSAEEQRNRSASPDDAIVAAARAAIPADLLALLTAGAARPASPKAGKAGAMTASRHKGRPAGSRPGDPRQGRLDLIATLRAAAPWQRLRLSSNAVAAIERAALGASGRPPREKPTLRILVRPEDFRIRRFSQHTETTTIFAVDASGSAALERLAEAKGAVELLLAEAYTRRDKVALVAFRGRSADLILPPTRSLVRARRGLAGLPGGGGTPLAAGIDAAGALALGIRRAGGTPMVVLLTDGRANVARSGEAGRAEATADALGSAKVFRTLSVRAILIDTAARPQDGAHRLAQAMGAHYLPLPYAEAGVMSAAIRSAT